MQTEIIGDFKDEKNEIRELDQRRFRALQRLWLNSGPDPWNQTKKVSDFMTREQKRRARRGALYIMFLTVLALLLAAMVTS